MKLRNKCKLSLVISKRQKPEHDRFIFTNYFYLSSGDSFNYFDEKGNVRTNNTKMDFYSMAELKNYADSETILHKLKEYIDNALEFDKKNLMFGTLENRLLDF